MSGKGWGSKRRRGKLRSIVRRSGIFLTGVIDGLKGRYYRIVKRLRGRGGMFDVRKPVWSIWGASRMFVFTLRRHHYTRLYKGSFNSIYSIGSSCISVCAGN